MREDGATARELSAEVALRSFEEREGAEQAAVALAAVGIPNRVVLEDRLWRLLVAIPLAFRAKSVLDSLDAEALERERDEAGQRPAGSSVAGWAAAAALVGFYWVVGPRDPASRWFAAGAADAARIAAGEWWRAATALTLHGDLEHLFGNATAAVILLGALASVVGAGTAVWTSLLAGVAGNLLAARTGGAGRTSVGASTAIFGALGAATALALTRPGRFRQRLLALGAGLGLLGLLGTGPGTDLAAHGFGFLAGAALGFAAGTLRLDRFRRTAAPQAILAALAAAAVAGAWALALRP